MSPILSRNQIKFIRTLKQKKYRYKFKNYLIEGEKIVSDMWRHKAHLIEYIVVEDTFSGWETASFTEAYRTDSKTFNMLSNMIQPQGIMAVCKIPELYFDPQWNDSAFTIYLDGIQDPGNLGTILRSAEWFGVDQILIGTGTADPYSPKAAQAAMGSQSYLNLYQAAPPDVIQWPYPIMVADMLGKNAYQHQWSEEGVIVLGNEGQGISPEFEKTASIRLNVPPAVSTQSESLNVSMACTVLLTLRQAYFLK